MGVLEDEADEEGGADAVDMVVALEASELRCLLCLGDLNDDVNSFRLARFG